MKTFNVSFDCPENFWSDWIPEDQLETVKRECAEHGVTMRIRGEVSWQQQLAAMENPEI